MIQVAGSGDHNQVTHNGRPPQFASAEHWLAHYREATTSGRRPWPPLTRQELLTAEANGILETHPEWIPCRVGLRLLNLPDCFGRTLDPYGERFRERFLSTLNADPMFASAVLNLLRQEG